MARKLKVTVYVTGEDGRPKALLPGTEPSAEEAKGIDNPDVWEDGEGDASESSKSGRKARSSTEG